MPKPIEVNLICPYCQHAVTKVICETSIDDTDSEIMSGAFYSCKDCGEISRFDKTLNLTVLTETIIEKMEESFPAFWDEMLRLQKINKEKLVKNEKD